jgi:hypothetical protein
MKRRKRGGRKDNAGNRGESRAHFALTGLGASPEKSKTSRLADISSFRRSTSCCLLLSFISSLCFGFSSCEYCDFHSQIILTVPRLSLRRSALRILSSSPSTFTSRRALTSFSSQSLRSKPTYQLHQRRWASTENEEGTPISKLQPTPQQEVENAIHEDAAAQESVLEPAPVSETAPADVANADSNAAPLTEQPARERRDWINNPNPPKPCIYIGNLFFDITEEDLSKEMARFGQVTSVRLMRDSRGLSKGYSRHCHLIQC